jgi:hypothetical protein
MRCEKFETLWNDCLDQRTSPQSNEQLSAHAAVCPKCAELMAGGELLNFAFPGLPQPALSVNFSDRIVARLGARPIENAPIPVAYEVFSQVVNDSRAVSHGSNYRKRFGSKIIFWSSGVAAAIAVIGTLALTRPNGNDGQKVNVTPNAPNVVNVVQSSTVVQPNTVAQSIKTPQQAIASVTPAENATSASDYFPESSTVAVGSVFRRDHMSQVGFAVADGITPVTKSVSYALQSFKKSTVKEPNESPRPLPVKRVR